MSNWMIQVVDRRGKVFDVAEDDGGKLFAALIEAGVNPDNIRLIEKEPPYQKGDSFDFRVGDVVTCSCDPDRHLVVANTEHEYQVVAYPVMGPIGKGETTHPRRSLTLVWGAHRDDEPFTDVRAEFDSIYKRLERVETYQAASHGIGVADQQQLGSLTERVQDLEVSLAEARSRLNNHGKTLAHLEKRMIAAGRGLRKVHDILREVLP